MIDPLIAKFKNWKDFSPKEDIDGTQGFKLYDYNYENGLPSETLSDLKHFGEGELKVGPIKFTRKYLPSGCSQQQAREDKGDKYTYY